LERPVERLVEIVNSADVGVDAFGVIVLHLVVVVQ
tara:strand:- start:135 stop:239 length:105 start_codon:yes stop_codon:yes gene_type:complete